MGNASQQVQAQANFGTLSNQEEGICLMQWRNLFSRR